MTDRRFNEEEVAAIFRQATEARPAPARELPTGDGLTLAELQEIGNQVGIPSDALARAAASVGQIGTSTSTSFIGLPIGVGRSVDLDRMLSDGDWDRLVVDLRETFDARGIVRQDGALRQWSNGNLHVFVEPTTTGQRVRLRTFNGNARVWMMGGLAVLGIAAATAIAAAVGGANSSRMTSVAELGVIGIGLLTINALRLPRWARLRSEQMAAIIGRLMT